MKNQLNPTNCLNCGAALEYPKINYDDMDEYEIDEDDVKLSEVTTIKCKYCKTEYHIDGLGRIEEYKVKLLIDGKIHQFYLSKLAINHLWSSDSGRDRDGFLHQNLVGKKMKVELVEL